MTSTEPPEWLRQLQELQVQVEQLAEKFSAGLPTQETHDGSDPTGIVRATVDGRGRLRDLALDPDWRRTLPEGEFIPAVLAAIQAADRDRLTAAMQRITDFEPKPPTGSAGHVPDAPDAFFTETLLSYADPLDDRAQQEARDLMGLLEAADRELPDALRAARQRATRQFVGTDGNNRAKVRLTADGTVVAIELDERALRRASDGSQFAAALTEAFKAAYRELDNDTGDTARGPALRELQALTDDPHQLLRRLFGG